MSYNSVTLSIDISHNACYYRDRKLWSILAVKRPQAPEPRSLKRKIMFYFNISQYGYIPENTQKTGIERYKTRTYYSAKNVRQFKRQLSLEGYTPYQIHSILSPRNICAFLFKGDIPYEVFVTYPTQMGGRVMEFHEIDPHSLKFAHASWARKNISMNG
jgi:hypothetical protein